MRPLGLYSAVEQVTQHLREELHSGLWREVLPGVNRLAAELGVNHKTVEAAVRQLEQEGLLQKPGHRRPRLIRRCGQKAKKPLRVVILPGEAADRKVHYMTTRRLCGASRRLPTWVGTLCRWCAGWCAGRRT